MRLRVAVWGLLLFPTLAWAAGNARLADARAKVEDLEYEAALKALDAAAATPGNDRPDVLEILELQGVCWATLGKNDKARNAFRALLVLDPDHALSGAQPPRVKTPFYEAKEWAAKSGSLTLDPTIDRRGRQITAVSVAIPRDALKLARTVVLHVDIDGNRTEERVAITDALKPATVKVGVEAVKWWAEILGDRDAVLVRVGTEAAPRVEEPPKPADAPVAQKLEPTTVTEPAPTPGRNQRIAGAVVGLAGVAALVVGAALGATSLDARNQIANAARDANGNVTGLTQRRAAELDAQAQTFGATANLLLIGGGVLAAGGLVLVLFAPDDAVVVVTPAPGGAAVSGRF